MLCVQTGALNKTTKPKQESCLDRQKSILSLFLMEVIESARDCRTSSWGLPFNWAKGPSDMLLRLKSVRLKNKFMFWKLYLDINSYITIRTRIRDLFLPETQMYLTFILSIVQWTVTISWFIDEDIHSFFGWPLITDNCILLHIVKLVSRWEKGTE